jgi:hypothetical protein
VSCKDCGSTTRKTPHPGPRCATCHREVVKARRQKARESRVEKIYGLSPDDLSAILTAQGNVCALCQKPFIKRNGSVDHDHSREHLGMRASVRGVIHGWENTIIGRLGDDPERFRRIADYLENPPARRVLG